MKKNIRPIAVFLTDTHYTARNISLQEIIYEEVLEYCSKHNISVVGHIGDIFTSRESQRLDILLSFRKIIQSYESLDVQIYAIAGNHDKTDQSVEESYLDIFENDCFRVQRGNNDFLQLEEGINLFFLPYFSSEEYIKRLKWQVKKVQSLSKDRNILITHQAINGVRNNDGTLVEDHCSQSLFEHFDLVFVGHYHNRQQLSNNIFYIGSAFQHNYGEDNAKGFVVLYNDLSFEYIQTSFPEYVQIKHTPQSLSDEIVEELKRIKQNDPSTHVRVTIEGKGDELMQLDIATLKQAGIDIKSSVISKTDEEVEVEAKRSIYFDQKSLKTNFKDYCIANKLDKSILVQGLKLLNHDTV